tara:strand:- start:346 stop:1155 length:810 start_codon:yes stop_codon:yes gene_type:complete
MGQITVTYIDHMGSDLSVVNAARVSFGKVSRYYYGDEPEISAEGGSEWAEPTFLLEKDQNLIKYLAKHNHISPFGHAFASYHIVAPIFVARQLVKHKFLRWNEISRRYVDDPPEFYTPDEWRGRSADKKQGSEGVIPIDKIDAYSGKHIKDTWKDTIGSEIGIEYNASAHYPEYSLSEDYKYNCDELLVLYDKLLAQGVAPEQARMVLPQSTMTEWYWSGSLDAFADMCNLRCKPDTQYETRLVANQICDKMRGLFPVSWVALRGLLTP